MMWCEVECLDLEIKRDDALAVAEPGCDNGEAVAWLAEQPYIVAQLKAIPEQDIKAALRSWGFTDNDDNERNTIRLLWIAAWNIYDTVQIENQQPLEPGEDHAHKR